MKFVCFLVAVVVLTYTLGHAQDDQLIQQALKNAAVLQAGKVDNLRFNRYSTATQAKLTINRNHFRNYSANRKAEWVTLGTAAYKNIPASGNATATEIVFGTDTRMTDSRNAADVYAWAKASVKPSYTYAEVGADPAGAAAAVTTTSIGALPAGAQAADSNKLNGQLASYYQTALGFTPMETDYSNAGTAPTWNQSTTGSAAKLTTPRAINGVNFDGSAAIQTATANTSDYATGTWTPVIRGSGTAGTYQQAAGTVATYTVIGNRVYVDAFIPLDSSVDGGGTGYIQITGLPYSKATGLPQGALTLNNIAYTSGAAITMSFPSSGSTSILCPFQSIYNGAYDNIPIAGVVANSLIAFSIVYQK